jgi:hypothetical protein
LIKPLNHFSPNDFEFGVLCACERGAGVSRNANNVEQQQYVFDNALLRFGISYAYDIGFGVLTGFVPFYLSLSMV